MAILRYRDGETVTTLLSTELNAMANGARVLSDPHDNTSDLDVYADFELLVKYSVAPSNGTKVVELYIVPTIDDINYAEGSISVIPQRYLLIGIFETVNPSISSFERLIIPNVVIPPRNFKVLIRNTSGQDFAATGNTLRMKKFKLESI